MEESYIYGRQQYRLPVSISLAFGFAFLDSFVSYFGVRFGFSYSSVLFILFFIIYFSRNPRFLFFNDSFLIIGLFLYIFGLILGVISIDEMSGRRLLQITSATSAFLIGYIFFVHGDVRRTKFVIFVSSCMYVAVCFLALIKVDPNLFPTFSAYWSDGFNVIERPSITTDQNFQVFYLLPVAVMPLLSKNKIELFVTAILSIICLYVLVRLQTRSGILIFFAAFVLSYILIKRYSRIENPLVLFLLLLVFFLYFYFHDFIMDQARDVLERFDGGVDKQAAQSAIGRFYSTTYVLDKIINPMWWLPRGSSEFEKLAGDVPHSNFAAIFLEGGILSLVGWMLLTSRPFITFINWRLRGVGNFSLALIGVFSSITLLQMSLNVPVMDQVWLWLGAANGWATNVKYIGRKSN